MIVVAFGPEKDLGLGELVIPGAAVDYLKSRKAQRRLLRSNIQASLRIPNE